MGAGAAAPNDGSSANRREIPAGLARPASSGDRAAFAELARIYGPNLIALFRSLGVPLGETDDLAQDALIKAWRALGDFDPARPFRTWLFQIALNQARHWKRRRRVRAFFYGAAELTAADQAASAATGPDPESHAGDRDLLRQIARLVAGLPPALRAYFVLTNVAGLAYAEAGDALGLTGKAVER